MCVTEPLWRQTIFLYSHGVGQSPGGEVMGLFRLLFLLIVSAWLGCSPAQAEKRVALVIGNSDYQGVAKLPNPANDAAAVAAMLKSAGFDLVDSRLNVTAGDLRKTL